MQGINNQIKKTQKKVVFADGEDENTLKAAIAFKNAGLGIPLIVAKEEIIKKKLKEIGYSENFNIEIVNAKKNKILREKYIKFLFNKLHRKEGLLERDCDKMTRNDRVIWASCMVECGDADAMVTGNTRLYSQSLTKITKDSFKIYGNPNLKLNKTYKIKNFDKDHRACMLSFIAALTLGGNWIINL